MANSQFCTVVRKLSTSSVTHQMIKAPLQVFGLEGRYATALYSAATKTKQLDTVEKDLVKIQSALHTDLNFAEFIKNPTFKRSIKANALKSVGEKLKFSVATTYLLELLAENGRLGRLNNVINSFKMIMAAHRGEVTCEVTTAKPMDAAQRTKLEATLKTFLKPNQTIQLTTKVDPTIIGGMIVSIGDKYIDMSIVSKVKKYTDLISVAV